MLEQYATDVHTFVARRVDNEADAADLAQQTLLQASIGLDGFRGGNFRAWLFTIARHLVTDYYRTQTRFRFVELPSGADGSTASVLRTSPQGVSEMCDCEQQLDDWLDDVATRLVPEEQVAVLLADAYGYRHKDSAPLLNMSIPAFKLLLHMARTRLRDRIERHAQGVHPDSRAGVHPGHHNAAHVKCHIATRDLLALRKRLVRDLIKSMRLAYCGVPLSVLDEVLPVFLALA